MAVHHQEKHRTEHVGWHRAAVLGANDGIVSTASLVVGVAAASAASSEVLLAGVAGLVAGAMSMAAGEYVSVSSQADTEKADLTRERKELAMYPEFERSELAGIYVNRGVEPSLATKVAEQLMAHDALAAHAREESSPLRQLEQLDEGDVANGNEAVTRRYEFYTYTGGYDPENHEALHDSYDPAYVGDFLGNQNVAANLAPIPEPSTFVLSGIAALALAWRSLRRKR
ncbi:MAG: VIT1/CCC1 transporter family protein [Pirellulales bacterium]